ncbi:TPA: murein transglycosylase A [Photobacterium damselae]
MLRKATIAMIMLGLVGCSSAPEKQQQVSTSRPNEFGHQYTGNYFSRVLNRVSHVTSNKPSDYSNFADQADEVTVNSSSMDRKYGPLYRQLEKWIKTDGKVQDLTKYGIQAAQLGGSDDRGNVMFTGYYSPVLEIRHYPDAEYKYPVYAMPKCKGRCPSRAQIYAGALKGQGLELGYSKSMIDVFMMEVQGSGFVHYGDNDEMQYFGYAGKNGHRYVSIGKVLIDRGEVPRDKMSLKAIHDWAEKQSPAKLRELLEQNPSYVFFERRPSLDVKGSAGIPLLADSAVAGDRKYFPMGSVILAEVPKLNEAGHWTGKHQLQLFIVLDTGGAVKRNHFDIYHGRGEKAGIAAGHYKHFGCVWKLGLKGTATQDPWLMANGQLSD